MAVSTFSHCALLRALAYGMRWSVRCRRCKPMRRRRSWWCAVPRSAKCSWPRVDITHHTLHELKQLRAYNIRHKLLACVRASIVITKKSLTLQSQKTSSRRGLIQRQVIPRSVMDYLCRTSVRGKRLLYDRRPRVLRKKGLTYLHISLCVLFIPTFTFQLSLWISRGPMCLPFSSPVLTCLHFYRAEGPAFSRLVDFHRILQFTSRSCAFRDEKNAPKNTHYFYFMGTRRDSNPGHHTLATAVAVFRG